MVLQVEVDCMESYKVTFRQYYLIQKITPNMPSVSIVEEEMLNEKKVRKRLLGKSNGWKTVYLKKLIEKIKMDIEKSEENLSISRISEESAFRLALAIRALSWVRGREPADFLVNIVSSMQREEVYFWYSKVIESGKNKAAKALRVLYVPNSL